MQTEQKYISAQEKAEMVMSVFDVNYMYQTAVRMVATADAAEMLSLKWMKD